jgi:hypothetical protein
MTFEKIDKARVLAVIDALGRSQLVEFARTSVLSDERDSFTVAAEKADVLRNTLEIKFSIARSQGKMIDGDLDLLVELHELGQQNVSAVVLGMPSDTLMIYMTAVDLDPIGVVRIGR